MKEYLTSLRQTHEFQNLLEWVGKQRPEVPDHVVSPDNTEIWKAQSHERCGFEFCLSIFSGDTKNER